MNRAEWLLLAFVASVVVVGFGCGISWALTGSNDAFFEVAVAALVFRAFYRYFKDVD